MPRTTLLTTAIVLLLLGIAHGLYWHWSAGQIESRLAEWRDEQRRKGVVVTYRGPVISGYPTEFKVQFSEPRVTAANGWRWAGPEVTGRSALWSPFTIAARYPGRHEISRAGLERAIEVELGRAETEVRLRADGQVDRAQGLWRDGTIRGAGEGPVSFDTLVIDLGPQIDAEADSPQQLAFSGEVRAVRLPELEVNPLGRQIERVSLRGTLFGRIDGDDPRDALNRWRDADGSVELRESSALWGPLAVTGSGRLGLDDALRPAGALATKVRGLEETLEAVSAQKLIEPGVAVAAKLGLAVLPRERDAEGRGVLPLPVTLRDGLLYINFGLGPVPLVRLDPVL